jgi:hypothetical protein
MILRRLRLAGDGSGTHTPLDDGKVEVLTQLLAAAGEQGCDAIVLGVAEEKIFATSNGTPLYKTHQSASCLVDK